MLDLQLRSWLHGGLDSDIEDDLLLEDSLTVCKIEEI
jgi:hypothetical protein